APARLIEGGIPTESLIAHVLVSKYADHCPLYRQAQIYARQGIELDRSTLADWVGRAAGLLAPVQARLFEILKSSPKLFADETRTPVLDPGRKALRQIAAFYKIEETIRGQSAGQRQSIRNIRTRPLVDAFKAGSMPRSPASPAGRN